MSEEYSIIEQARDARKVSWVCLHCGCSIEEAAKNVLDKPERFIAEWKTSLGKLAEELGTLGG